MTTLMTTSRYPETIRASLAAEKSVWTIGDALLAEAGQNATREDLKRVAEALAERGVEYSPIYLGHLHRTAKFFPSNRRIAHLSFNIHKQARNPEKLDAIVAAAKAMDVKVDARFVTNIVAQWRETERLARNKAKEEARRDRVTAWHAKSAATQRLKKAKTTEDKEAAIRDRNQARTAFNEARTRENLVKFQPEMREITEGEVAPLVSRMGIVRSALEAKRLAKSSQDVLDKSLADMPETMIRGLFEDAQSALHEWQGVVETLRRRVRPGSRLTAVINE